MISRRALCLIAIAFAIFAVPALAKQKSKRVAANRYYASPIAQLTSQVHGNINGMTALTSNGYYDMARFTSGDALTLDRAARAVRYASRAEKYAAQEKYAWLRYYQAQYSYATAYYLYLGMQAAGDSFDRIQTTYDATILATVYAEADLDAGF